MTDAKEVQKDERRPRFVNYFFSDPIYPLIAVTLLAVTGYGLYHAGKRILDHHYPRQPALMQKNVVGNPQPDLYLERDGVRYYSRIDGKSIDELVK